MSPVQPSFLQEKTRQAQYLLQEVVRIRQQAQTENPGHVLSGLNQAAYSSEDFFRLEQQRVFAKGWVFVGFAHEFTEAGSCVPIDVAGQPLLIMTNEQNQINVFHNICRHRGVKLVTERCTAVQSISCPYHAWAYDLNGKLEASPHFGGFRQQEVPGFSRVDYGLKPVRHYQWHDWIFVNLSGDAADFEYYVSGLARQIHFLDVKQLSPIGKIDLGEVRCNWKFLMENFIEPYHVPVVHHATASGQPLQHHYTIIDELCLGSAVDVEAEKQTTAKSHALDMSARYLTLFPNFVLGIYLPDQAGVHLNIPISAECTRQYRVLYAIGEQNYSEQDKENLCQLWYRVHKEDHAIAELLQQGRRSSVMDDGGLMSPHWENSANQFQNLLLQAMQA